MKEIVFLLRWNPRECTFSEEDFLDFRKYYFLKELDWCLADYQKFNINDRNLFFLISDSNICPGILMKGVLKAPFLKNDSLKEKCYGPLYNSPQAYYSKLHIQYIAKPFCVPFISFDKIKEKIPTFDWDACRNGELIPVEIGKKLICLWDEFEKNNADYFRALELEREVHIDPEALDKIENYYVCPDLNELLRDDRDEDQKLFDWFENCKGQLICANTKFSIDYNDNTGVNIGLFIKPNKILYIKCKKVINIETNIGYYRECINEFYIYRLSFEYIQVISNGITITCSDVEFLRLEDYSGEEPLRHIILL